MSLRIPLLLVSLSACFALPPSVPDVARPTLPEDKFLEIDSGSVTERRSWTQKTGETCAKGSVTNCVEHKERRSKNVNVRVAAASMDGRPVSIGEVASAASPEYVKDTEKLDGLTSRCRRGRIIMGVGAVGLAAAYYFLQVGYAEDNPRPSMQIAGWAALGAGVVGLAGGKFLFGGQHCGEASELYRRWQPVYTDPDATASRGASAEMLERLVDKFNRDREQTLRAQAAELASEPAADDDVVED